MGKRFSDEDEQTSVVALTELQRELQQGRSAPECAHLIVLAGANVGEMYRVEAAETLIGRSAHAPVRLADDGVSRRHAMLRQSDAAVWIEDLGSQNGTFVNGARIERQSLRDGDKIRIGSTTILKFSHHDELDESFQRHMHDAALRDPLTGAYNKRYLLDRLEREFSHATRHRSPLSLIMLDIDHFKQVNDVYGHLTGDQALVSISAVCRSMLRAEDVFARYGGEEFAVLGRGLTLHTAASVAERIRRQVETTPIDHEQTRLQVTVSAGVGALPELEAPSALDLLAAADAALYEAKRAGRNRVMLAPTR